MILNDVNTAAIPNDLELPDSFSQLVLEMKNNQYDARTFALMLRAMVCYAVQLHVVFLSDFSVCYFVFCRVFASFMPQVGHAKHSTCKLFYE